MLTITVRILNCRGETASRDEAATLFAADLDYVPWRREAEVSREGLITLTAPAGPVILQAKLHLPGYGFMWVTADNQGRGYGDGAEIEFVREAAETRVLEVEQVIAGDNGPGRFEPSVKCRSLLAEAKTMLALAERADSGDAAKAAEYRLTALAAALWAGDLAVVERARARIAARSWKRENFLFGCAGFDYPWANSPGLRETFDSVFNYATLPFYLARVENEKGKPDYTTLEKLQGEFETAGITTKGHPLWWAHTAGMPPWARDLSW